MPLRLPHCRLHKLSTHSGGGSKHLRDSELEAETVSCYSILIYNYLRAAAHIRGHRRNRKFIDCQWSVTVTLIYITRMYMFDLAANLRSYSTVEDSWIKNKYRQMFEVSP